MQNTVRKSQPSTFVTIPPDVIINAILTFVKVTVDDRKTWVLFGIFSRDPSRHVWFIFLNVAVRRIPKNQDNRSTIVAIPKSNLIMNFRLVERLWIEHDADRFFSKVIGWISNFHFRNLELFSVKLTDRRIGGDVAWFLLNNKFNVLDALQLRANDIFVDEPDWLAPHKENVKKRYPAWKMSKEEKDSSIANILSKLKRLDFEPAGRWDLEWDLSKQEVKIFRFNSFSNLDCLELSEINFDKCVFHENVKQFSNLRRLKLFDCRGKLQNLFIRLNEKMLTHLELLNPSLWYDEQRPSIPSFLSFKNLRTLVLYEVDLNENDNLFGECLEHVDFSYVRGSEKFLTHSLFPPPKLISLSLDDSIYIPETSEKTWNLPNLKELCVCDIWDEKYSPISWKFGNLKNAEISYHEHNMREKIKRRVVDPSFASHLEKLTLRSWNSSTVFCECSFEILTELYLYDCEILDPVDKNPLPNLKILEIRDSMRLEIDEFMQNHEFPSLERFTLTNLDENDWERAWGKIGGQKWKILNRVERLTKSVLMKIRKVAVKERKEIMETKEYENRSFEWLMNRIDESLETKFDKNTSVRNSSLKYFHIGIAEDGGLEMECVDKMLHKIKLTENVEDFISYRKEDCSRNRTIRGRGWFSDIFVDPDGEWKLVSLMHRVIEQCYVLLNPNKERYSEDLEKLSDFVWNK